MHFTPPVRVWRGPRLHDNNEEFSEFTIWGPTCDSYDVLPQVFTLPSDIDEDDWIEFGLMGAYTRPRSPPSTASTAATSTGSRTSIGQGPAARIGRDHRSNRAAPPGGLSVSGAHRMDDILPLTSFGRRIMICGPSSSGKSTLAVALAAKLGVPPVHLDQLHHLPGTDWVKRPEPEFTALHDAAIAADAWVMRAIVAPLPAAYRPRHRHHLLGDNRWANFARYLKRTLFQSVRPGALAGGRNSLKWDMVAGSSWPRPPTSGATASSSAVRPALCRTAIDAAIAATLAAWELRRDSPTAP